MMMTITCHIYREGLGRRKKVPGNTWMKNAQNPEYSYFICDEDRLDCRLFCYGAIPPLYSQTTVIPESQNQQWRPPENRRDNEARRSLGE